MTDMIRQAKQTFACAGSDNATKIYIVNMTFTSVHIITALIARPKVSFQQACA
jgi:hypothetical protein